MKYLLGASFSLMLLVIQGCSTTYAPPENMSVDRSVPQFDVVGAFTMDNGYEEPHEITVLDSFINTSTADLSVSTDVYIDMVQDMVERHAVRLESDAGKSVTARVTDLGTGVMLLGMGPVEGWAEVTLALGAEDEVHVVESKVILPSGTGYKDALNEALAWAVIETLRDENVVGYLSTID